MNQSEEVKDLLTIIGVVDIDSYLAVDVDAIDHRGFYLDEDLKPHQVVVCKLLKDRGKRCGSTDPWQMLLSLGLTDTCRKELEEVIETFKVDHWGYSKWNIFEIAIEYAVGANPPICTSCHLTLDDECQCEISGKEAFPQ